MKKNPEMVLDFKNLYATFPQNKPYYKGVIMSEKVAKNISEAVRKSVIYQIFLRAFTPEGTLPAAEKLLPHLAGLGVDILYLCPIVLADDDPDINHWHPVCQRLFVPFAGFLHIVQLGFIDFVQHSLLQK